MKKEWKSVIAILLSTLIGSGAVWQYWSLKNDDMRLNIDRNNQIIKLYSKVTELFDQYLKLREEYSNIALQNIDNSNKRANDDQKEKIEAVSFRVRIIREEIINAENTLADVEERKPRKLLRGLRPLPPFVPGHQVLKVIRANDGEIIYSDKLIFTPPP